MAKELENSKMEKFKLNENVMKLTKENTRIKKDYA
jgi:hypothetical protein